MGLEGGEQSSSQWGTAVNRGIINHRKKFELSLFKEDNPHGWVFQIERYTLRIEGLKKPSK